MTNTLPHTEIQTATATASASASAAAAATAAAAAATAAAAAAAATTTTAANTPIASQQATEITQNSQAMIRSVETQTETQTYKDTISFQNDVFTEIIQKCENIKENIQNLIKASDIEIQTIIDTITNQNIFKNILATYFNFQITIEDFSNNSNIFILISTLEFQIHLLLKFISTNNFTQTQFASIKFKFITIAQILNQIADNSQFKTKIITRPRGRTPRGKKWNNTLGKWEDDITTNYNNQNTTQTQKKTKYTHQQLQQQQLQQHEQQPEPQQQLQQQPQQQPQQLLQQEQTINIDKWINDTHHFF